MSCAADPPTVAGLRSGRRAGRSVMMFWEGMCFCWRAPRQAGMISPVGTTRRRIRRFGTKRNWSENIGRSPALGGRRGRRKNAQAMGGPSGGKPQLCIKRDPPEEPPSEESYGAEGRSPGLRVVMAIPAFPSPLQRLSDTKWNRHSPLTVAGAAPDFARKASPASRLSPAVMPEAGNLDRMVQHHRRPGVKVNIKKPLYWPS